MPGFLTNLGLQIGQNILTGQELQSRQADIDLKKQQLQMGAIALQEKQQQQQTQQAVGSFLSSEAAKDASNVTDPVKAAGEYTKASAIAVRNGDFASANTLGELAKGKLNEAKEQAAVQAQQQQVKKEALSTAAEDYSANPTAEGASDLMRKAVDAGVNPSTIPMPGTPQFGSWVNAQQLASKTASQRADFTQKAYEMQENRQLKQEEFRQREQDRQEQRRQTAAMREAMEGDRRERLQLERDRLEDEHARVKQGQDRIDLDREKFKATQEGGGKMSAQQQRDTTAIAGAAAEGVRNLNNISKFPIGTAGSPFQNLSDHGILDAVSRAGTNAFTPDTVQMFQTAGAGLATQVGRVETLGGGRGINQAQVNQLEKQLTPVAGDHPMTQLYKVATGAELLLTRMKNTPGPREPELKAEWDATKAQLAKYPKPEDVLAASQGAQKKELLKFDESYAANLNRVRDDVAAHPAEGSGTIGLPGTPDTGKGNSPASPIPAGWSVKAH